MSASPSVLLGSPAGLLVVTLARGDIGGRGDARWVFAVADATSLPGDLDCVPAAAPHHGFLLRSSFLSDIFF